MAKFLVLEDRVIATYQAIIDDQNVKIGALETRVSKLERVLVKLINDLTKEDNPRHNQGQVVPS